MGKCYTIVNNAQNDLIDFTRFNKFVSQRVPEDSTFFGNGVYGVRAYILEKNLYFLSLLQD